MVPMKASLFLVLVMLSGSRIFAQQRASANSAKAQSSPGIGSDVATKADEAREAGRLEEAIGLYQQALKTQPKWLEGWWYLATLLYDRSRYTDAKQAFQQVIALEPKNGAALAMFALCEFELKDFEQSLADLERARGLGIPNNIELLSVVCYHDGILLTKYGRFADGHQALIYLARYQNASPNVIEAFGLNVLQMPFLPGEEPQDKLDLVNKVGRAIFCMLARRPTEAKDAFETLVAKYPSTPRLHYFYGVFLNTEHSDAAIDQFKKELELSPDDIYSMLQIASEYINRNDYTTALPYAQKAVELAQGQAAPHVALGRILVETGKLDEGIGQLELAERFDNSNPKVHFALAHAYARAKRNIDAKRERETFLELDKAERERWGKNGPGGPPPDQSEKLPDKPNDKPEKPQQ